MKRILAALALCALMIAPVMAQSPITFTDPTGRNLRNVSSANPLPTNVTGTITGSVTATITTANAIPVTGTISPTAALAAAIIPVVTSAITGTQVIKSSAGNLYGFAVTSSGTAGYVLLIDSTTTPGNGAVAPVKCYKLAANSTLAASWLPGPALRFVNGIIAVYSSTGCFTNTLENTAFFSSEAQ